MDAFAPFSKNSSSFIVKNITSDRRKTIKIFNYPINFNQTRDLLQIPGIAEQDIRASLLKGELKHKILAQDIIVEYSDIDLLQFNIEHRNFLKSSGILNGLQITSKNINVIRKEDIVLIGIVNNINNIFTIPHEKFIYDSIYKIIVYNNGVKQLLSDDYIIAEGEGPGTGFDTVIFTIAPVAIPEPPDVITADYYIDNT